MEKYWIAFHHLEMNNKFTKLNSDFLQARNYNVKNGNILDITKKKRKDKELSLNGRNLVTMQTSPYSGEMKDPVMLRSLSCNSPRVSRIKKWMMRTYTQDANSTNSVVFK